MKLFVLRKVQSEILLVAANTAKEAEDIAGRDYHLEMGDLLEIPTTKGVIGIIEVDLLYHWREDKRTLLLHLRKPEKKSPGGP